MRKKLTVFLWLLLFLNLPAGESAASQQAYLTLNSADTEPYSNPQDTGFYDRLVSEMFATLQIPVRINHLPSARSLNNANDGIDDGEYGRIKGLEKDYPNLVMVEEKLIDFNFTIFSADPEFSPEKGWDSFRTLNIAYINGWKFLDRHVRDYKSLIRVADHRELFALLAAGRVDVVIYEKWRGLHHLDQEGLRGIYAVSPPLASKGMYLYLHRRHRQLIPSLEAALRKLKKTGRYREIYSATLAQSD